MTKPNLVVVIPSYSHGASILPTLDTLYSSVQAWNKQPFTIIISDSSPTEKIIDECHMWAQGHDDVKVVMLHSHVRRHVKEALNVAFETTEISGTDLVLGTNDDVIFDINCVTHLLEEFIENPNATMAVGCVLPDRGFLTGRRRAGTWQLTAAADVITRMPRNSVRAEGAIWATRGEFVRGYRFPIGSGNIADDSELQSHIVRNNLKCLSIPEAVVYKIPPRGFKEFNLQYGRNRTSSSSTIAELPLRRNILVAGFINLVRDPIGAMCYLTYRVAMKIRIGKRQNEHGERWERATSTFR